MSFNMKISKHQTSTSPFQLLVKLNRWTKTGSKSLLLIEVKIYHPELRMDGRLGAYLFQSFVMVSDLHQKQMHHTSLSTKSGINDPSKLLRWLLLSPPLKSFISSPSRNIGKFRKRNLRNDYIQKFSQLTLSMKTTMCSEPPREKALIASWSLLSPVLYFIQMQHISPISEPLHFI
jgi:hypothetical protein